MNILDKKKKKNQPTLTAMWFIQMPNHHTTYSVHFLIAYSDGMTMARFGKIIRFKLNLMPGREVNQNKSKQKYY